MSVLGTLKDKLLGHKIANGDTRHKPSWLPGRFDYRVLGERFAVMSLPPYKPPYRRHGRYKAWVCMGPRNIIHLNAIIDVDLDERTLAVDLYR